VEEQRTEIGTQKRWVHNPNYHEYLFCQHGKPCGGGLGYVGFGLSTVVSTHTHHDFCPTLSRRPLELRNDYPGVALASPDIAAFAAAATSLH
jgi:hypothetical protein